MIVFLGWCCSQNWPQNCTSHRNYGSVLSACTNGFNCLLKDKTNFWNDEVMHQVCNFFSAINVVWVNALWVNALGCEVNSEISLLSLKALCLNLLNSTHCFPPIQINISLDQHAQLRIYLCTSYQNMVGLLCIHGPFIHSGYFYSTSSSLLLIWGTPETARILCRGFMLKCHRQLRIKNLAMLRTWRLERNSNPRPFGQKASNLPMIHHAPQSHSQWLWSFGIYCPVLCLR